MTTLFKDSNRVRSKSCIHRVFTTVGTSLVLSKNITLTTMYVQMLEDVNKCKVNYIMINVVVYDKEEESSYHLLWQVSNSKMLDFDSLLKNVTGIDHMDDYEVLCPKDQDLFSTHGDLYIHNQENFYHAVLVYVKWYMECDINEPMKIIIREKTDN